MCVCADRKSTRLNSSHLVISYAVFCLKKKKKKTTSRSLLNPQVLVPQTHSWHMSSVAMVADDLIRLDYPILLYSLIYFFFFFNDTATTEIYTLSLHDALPI